METKKFIDILEIYNGKNQKSVENPDGKYRIYGSGGVMGRADEYICPAETVVIGRKGSINNPIFVTEPFWNVDTAFGLVARKEVLLPKYLFYFCRYFDFEKLNTTVTIPSLTKANLLKIEIPIPSIIEQKSIVTKLNLLTDMIQQRQEQLTKLDELIKARFVEMFGDPYTNSKDYPLKKGESFFKLSNGKAVPESKRLNGGIPAYGGNGISWYTDESLFDADTIVVGRVGFQSGNVHLVKGPLWVTDNAMYMSSCDFSQYNLTFLIELMAHVDFTKFQDAGDLKKITQKPFMQFEYLCPPLSLQNQFAAFAAEVDKSKLFVGSAVAHKPFDIEFFSKSTVQRFIKEV
mgnify:CR=1 FL=1